MKNNQLFLTLLTIIPFIFSCGVSSVKNPNIQKEEPVVIANDSLEYEIIIIDLGFTNYLNTIAQPKNFYTQSFLEQRNLLFVNEWNNRVREPNRFNPNIYENIIEYQANTDYGYEVNYKLFNYFLFAQRKYNMSLFNGRNRIR